MKNFLFLFLTIVGCTFSSPIWISLEGVVHSVTDYHMLGLPTPPLHYVAGDEIDFTVRLDFLGESNTFHVTVYDYLIDNDLPIDEEQYEGTYRASA